MDGLECKEILLSSLLNENPELRIDSEYVLKEYLEYDAKISGMRFERVGSFADVTDGIHTSIEFDDNSDINLISAKAPKNNVFDLQATGYISKRQDSINARTRLRVNDIIISTVGTIGNCAVVNEEILPANSDRHVGIIRLHETSEYYPRYVSTFLLSKYGRFQTKRHTTGNVQPNLFIYKIKELKVPKLSDKFQLLIEKLIIETERLRKEAKVIYENAEKLLSKEIGFGEYSNPNERFSIKAFISSIKSFDRFDAEFYQEKYDILENILRKYDKDIQKLADINEYIFTGEYAEEYYHYEKGLKHFIRGTDIKSGYVEKDDDYCVESERFTKIVKTGDIITGRVGTIGNFGIIDESLDGAVCSDNILCFRLNREYIPEVYALYFNLPTVYELIARLARGSVQQRLNQETLRDILVPLINYEMQVKLKNMVVDSRQYELEARKKNQHAIKMIEIAIEKGENSAIKYYNSMEVG